VIHRFVDLLAPVITLNHPPFPYIAIESVSVNALWMMGDLRTPVELVNTRKGVLADPMVNPTNQDETLFAYANGSDMRIATVDMNTGSVTDVLTLTGATQNPFPYWHPNGTTIVYIYFTGSAYEVRSVESDGTNDQLLYTDTNVLTCCCFSPSGDYIAFGKGFSSSTKDQLWVMQDDGTSPGNVATILGPAASVQWSTPYTYPSWMNSSDVLGWMEMPSGGAPEPNVWRKVNADGTGLTTLLSDNSTFPPAPLVKWMGSGRFCWLADDSAMVSFKVDGSTNPRWRLIKVDAAGGGSSFLGSNFSYGNFTSNPFGQPSWRFSPIVFRGQFTDDRIYWTTAAASGDPADYDVVSVDASGGDLRTDDDGTVSPAHGYLAFSGREA